MKNDKQAVFLLVEDDETDAKIINETFKKSNILNNLHVVYGGEEALSYLYNRDEYSDSDSFPTPDLIFLDIKMPKINGFDILKNLSGDENLKNIPVIMLTTSIRGDDVDKSFKYGAMDYIIKPITVPKIFNAMKKLDFGCAFYRPLFPEY